MAAPKKGGLLPVPRNPYSTAAGQAYSRHKRKRRLGHGYVLGTPEPEPMVVEIPNAKCVDEHAPSDHDVMERIGVHALAFPIPEDCVRCYCVYLPILNQNIYIKYGEDITHIMSNVHFKFADFLNQLFVRTLDEETN